MRWKKEGIPSGYGLNAVYTALKEAGHNPTVQLVGYLVSGEPTYITSKHDARKLVSSIERDELVEELGSFLCNP